MTNQEIQELLQIFNDSGVAEMEVQRGENRLRLRRAFTAQEMTVPAAAPAHAPLPAAAPAAPAAKPSAPESNHVIVKSPIVGTYYEAPSPEAPAIRQNWRYGRARPSPLHHRIHEADE